MDEFRASLTRAAQAAENLLVVDLSEVDFIDSSGLGALVEVHERLQHERREVAVVAPPGSTAAVLLNLAGLQSRLPIFETRAAALANRAR